MDNIIATAYAVRESAVAAIRLQWMNGELASDVAVAAVRAEDAKVERLMTQIGVNLCLKQRA